MFTRLLYRELFTTTVGFGRTSAAHFVRIRPNSFRQLNSRVLQLRQCKQRQLDRTATVSVLRRKTHRPLLLTDVASSSRHNDVVIECALIAEGDAPV